MSAGRGWGPGRVRAGLVLLAVLWVAAAVPAAGTAVRVVSDRAAADRLEPLIGRVVLALEAERRLTVVARPGDTAVPAELGAQRTRTDQAGDLLHRAADGPAGRLRETATGRAADALVRRMSGLAAMRAAVDDGRMDRRAALVAYTGVLGSPLGDRPLTRARELLSEEDALLAAVAGTARLGDADRVRLGELAGARRVALAAGGGAGVVPAGAEERLRSLEDALLLAPGPVPEGWSPAFNTVNDALWERATSAVRADRADGTPYAVAVIVWAALAVGGGLIAVIALAVLVRRAARRRAAAPARPAAAAADGPSPAAPEGLDALLRDLERRNQGLVHRLLRVLDGLARHESDDQKLGELFRADHLANRTRRNLEKAIMLAGDRPGRRWSRPMPLAEVVRAAASEVPDYERVSTARIAPVRLKADAVTGTMHLLAELIENATTYAPAQTRVLVAGEPAPSGYEITVADVGPGMTEDDLATAHAVLADPAPHPSGTWWGLYAAGRLAAALGIHVRLRNAEAGGLQVSVILPPALLAGDDDDGAAAVPGDATTEFPAISAEVAGRS